LEDELVPVEAGVATQFQLNCAQRVLEVFSSHGAFTPDFVLGEGSPHWYWSSFRFRQELHRIEIYPKIVVMHQGDRYFECYLAQELVNEQTLIDGFATRLNRYLSGGPWASTDEKNLSELVKDKVSRLFKGARRSR
jgi:hypothetical protein